LQKSRGKQKFLINLPRSRESLKKEIKTRENSNKYYWNQRFSVERKIWGENPSKTAFYALELFKKYKIKLILIPGSGYGRNSKLFSKNHFHTVGIEISEIAFEIGKKYDPETKFINGSVLEMPFNDENFDAIYCYNTLHLFLRGERNQFLKKCYFQLNEKGFIFFTVFSEKDISFGRGKEIEENTFESKPGRPTHYFSKKDLLEHFKEYQIIETSILEDQENHGEIGKHTHKLRYIFAQKLLY